MTALTEPASRSAPEVVEAALDVPPDDRDAFLQDACQGNLELLGQLRVLLEADRHDDDFLALPTAHPLPAGPILPERVGPYRVLRELGRGSMGIVYEAEQAKPQRRVALKVLRTTLHRKELPRRFDRETAVLSRLHYPGIAAIYDAGTADVGGREEPFFAMEYIDGPPLLDYVESRKASDRERLLLFARYAGPLSTLIGWGWFTAT